MASVHSVTIRIPASTSNLGPGFDCLGVALRIYNLVAVSRTTKRELLAPIVARAADLFFKRTNCRRFAFSCSATEKIPRSRGLGSSATIRLGVLHGLNELARRPEEFCRLKFRAWMRSRPSAMPARSLLHSLPGITEIFAARLVINFTNLF